MIIIDIGITAAIYSSQFSSENKLLKIKCPIIDKKAHKNTIGISFNSDDINRLLELSQECITNK